MKRRLTIEGDWRQTPAGDWVIFNLLDETAVFREEIVVRVEDVPDPLPTEPGARFWGARGTDDPQWWFVQRRAHRPVYVPAETLTGNYVVDPATAGLVRLPDPEATP